ncbi:Hypothetical_protein [Hexamita inflata]|uniref:Hypothetical_protein n=1 Tax=Hexamita inflata TaxID=28002 RepID=A0AA86NLD9_9EUKA|nr:Hypothetical protein HINF_LOCUS9208 [Hexamita inflata]
MGNIVCKMLLKEIVRDEQSLFMSSPITFSYKYIDINQPSQVLIQVTKYSSSSQSVKFQIFRKFVIVALVLTLKLFLKYCAKQDNLSVILKELLNNLMPSKIKLDEIRMILI